MSLMAMIKSTNEKDKAFKALLSDVAPSREDYVTWSGKAAFSSEYELLAPSVVQHPVQAGLVGVAFDYLARLRIAQFLQREDVLQGMTWMTMYIQLTKTTELGFEAGESWIDDMQSFLRHSDQSPDTLIETVVRMAKLEQLYRSGREVDLNIPYIFEETAPAEVVMDLKRLVNVFETHFMQAGRVQKKSRVVFNPDFGVVSSIVGGADADIFIDGTLYDFKTGKNPGWRGMENLQMVGYYLLNEWADLLSASIYGYPEPDLNIREVAFYRARYGEVERCPIAELLPYPRIKDTIRSMYERFPNPGKRISQTPYTDKAGLLRALDDIAQGE